MRIQHNIMAMNAYRNYTSNVSAMKSNLEKLSSGYKINRAGDDAAGLAISEKMRAQITGLQTAQKNAKSGINLVQTAEGALTEVHDMLNRMVELATQSANGTYDNTTDRKQMQKEVNQLLEEIDRIADSANFNGIKLLDGTLGMNTDAFKVEVGADYKAAVDPKTTNFELASTGSLAFHYGDSVSAQAPSFKIDFDNLTFTNGTTALAAGDTIMTVAFGTASIDIAATGAVATGAKLTGTQLAALFAKAFNTGSVGGNASKCGVLASAGFNASAAGAVVTFTYQGVAAGGKVAATAVDTTGSKIASTAVDDLNALLGGPVTMTVATNAGTPKGTVNGEKQYICDITAPQNAVAKKDGTRPGAGIDIGSYVKNGYKLTIDNKTFVFKTGAASVTTKTGETLIDVSKWAADGGTKQAEMAAMMIAGGAGTTTNVGNAAGQAATTTDFKVSYGGGTKLHVDVKASKVTTAAGYKGAASDVQKKIESKLSWTDAGEDAVAASTKLTVTASNIKEGNTISITDGTTTTKYVFTTDAAKLKLTDSELPANTKYVEIAKNGAGTAVDATKTIEKLVDAIGTDTAEADGSVITISASQAAASVGAPIVLGKGLTLQIGDTSDDFNQLNVKVQDMHSASLGIGKLDIATEEAAQAAVDKIKAAINTVSDVRGTLGATQNRLDHTINNLSVMTENIQDAESTIRDTDVAEEMMAYTKNNILIQSAQAMLAQANQVPQGVLQLLG